MKKVAGVLLVDDFLKQGRSRDATGKAGSLAFAWDDNYSVDKLRND